MKPVYLALWIILVFFIGLAIFNSFSQAQEQITTKTFDLNNYEHRFAIALAMAPDNIIGITPVPEEHREAADQYCLVTGLRSGRYDTPIAAAGGFVVTQAEDGSSSGRFTVFCISDSNGLNQGDNQGWKDICKLFGLNYITKPSQTSVLCGVPLNGKVA